MVYRCFNCDAAGKGDCISDLTESISEINNNIADIKGEIHDIKSLKEEVMTNKTDIAKMKTNMSLVVKRVIDLKKVTKTLDPDAVTAECQCRIHKQSNLIVLGLSEEATPQAENIKIRQYLSKVKNINLNSLIINRIGKIKLDGKPCLICIRFSSASDGSTVLRSKDLFPQGVTINKDRTLCERNRY